MAGYGEGLSLDNMYAIYNSLKYLSKDILQKIKTNGYFYESDEDDDEEVHYYYLDWLITSKKGKKFFIDFVEYMKSKDYVLKYKGTNISSESLIQKIEKGVIDVTEDGEDKTCYFEYVGKTDKGVFVCSEGRLNKIYLYELTNEVYSMEGSNPGNIVYKSGILNLFSVSDVDENASIKGMFSPYALDGDNYNHIETDGVICYNPKIVGKYIDTDNTVNTEYYNPQLFMFLSDVLKKFNTVDKIYKVFDEFCPSLVGGYTWSNPKWLPKGSEEFLKKAISSNFEYTAHLYMKNGSPVIDFLFKDKGFDCNSCVNIDEVTNWVIRNFGNNVKEVYIVFNNGKLIGNEVIARKNPDGELTLTIY